MTYFEWNESFIHLNEVMGQLTCLSAVIDGYRFFSRERQRSRGVELALSGKGCFGCMDLGNSDKSFESGEEQAGGYYYGILLLFILIRVNQQMKRSISNQQSYGH